MSTVVNLQPTVVRTSRGLSIRGTRITLYQIMDCLKANISHAVICDRFRLTIKQMNDILAYIKQNQEEVEKEYQQVLDIAEKNRQYWENKNREKFAQIAKLPRTSEQEEIWRKLQAWKAEITQEMSES